MRACACVWALSFQLTTSIWAWSDEKESKRAKESTSELLSNFHWQVISQRNIIDGEWMSTNIFFCQCRCHGQCFFHPFDIPLVSFSLSILNRRFASMTLHCKVYTLFFCYFAVYFVIFISHSFSFDSVRFTRDLSKPFW